MLSFKKLYLISVGLLSVVISFFFVGEAKGQNCTPTERVYANNQTSSTDVTVFFVTLAEVNNKPNSVDGSLYTHSILSTYVGLLGLGTAWQNLRFPAAELPAGDNGSVPVSVKLGTGSTILNVLNNVTIQATLSGVPVGTAYSGASLLGLLSGQGENIITFTPGAKYDGVRVIINPIVDVGTSVDLYYAYFNKPSGAIACVSPIEVLSGSTGTIASSLTAVENPLRSIDGNLGLYAKINSTVTALNETYLTAVYPAHSVVGDSIRMIIESDNLALLNATILASDFHVRGFSGNTQVMDVAGNSPFLNLNLLNGSTTKYTITIPITNAFDKVQIATAGGLASLLNGLRIYEIQRIIAKPKISSIDLIANLITLCAGNTTTLTIGTAQDCTTYNWYNTAIGGAILHTGVSYTPDVSSLTPGDHIFYVESVRNNCTETSGRIPINIKINSLPSITLGTNPSICVETLTALLPFTATTETPISYSITWAGGSPLTNIVSAAFPASSPISIVIPAATPAATYAGTITVKNANGCISDPVNFNVIINPKLTSPSITITSN
ncbi:MAG: hypothetical protein EOO91_09995 [Pedobacter sp.]|nr:MAG: hypothetical protein EOO91_09995 [Pedobacter sp.]